VIVNMDRKVFTGRIYQYQSGDFTAIKASKNSNREAAAASGKNDHSSKGETYLATLKFVQE